MIDKDKLVYDLITAGHHKINDPEIFKFLIPAIKNITWNTPTKEEPYYFATDMTVEIEDALENTSRLIGETIVSLIDKEYKSGYNHIWNGTEHDLCEWHNDLREGPNLFLILYMSDIDSSCGGEIEFRSSVTKNITGSILPKKYDIIIGSQELSWEHQVGKFKCGPMERITCNFGYYIKWI